MTRTTELLKEIEECDIFIEKAIEEIHKNAQGNYNACKHADLIEKIRGLKCGKEERKSELRGHLDVLKELLSSKERHLKDLKECATNKIVGSWIWVNATIKRLTKELASIQEEIKLIESAGVGK